MLYQISLLNILFRRLSPSLGPKAYSQTALFIGGVNAALSGRAASVNIQSQTGPVLPTYLNFSFYGQDNWKITRRLSLTYGLRYEINPPPSEANDRQPATLLQVDDPKTFALAPSLTIILRHASEYIFSYRRSPAEKQHSGPATVSFMILEPAQALTRFLTSRTLACVVSLTFLSH